MTGNNFVVGMGFTPNLPFPGRRDEGRGRGPGDRDDRGPRIDRDRHDRGPDRGEGRERGPGREVGHDGGRGFDRGAGQGGLGLNAGAGGLNVNLGVVGLNVNLGVGAALGPGVMLDAGFVRPNDQGNDADAIARLRRQSEGVDLQSGRDSRGATAATGAGPGGGSGLTTAFAPAPAARSAGPAPQNGLAPAGPQPAAPAGPGGAGAGRAGSGGAIATVATPSPVAAPAAGPAPIATRALDRLVSALAEPPASPAQGRGQSGGEALAAGQAQTQRPAAPAPQALAAQADPALREAGPAPTGLAPTATVAAPNGVAPAAQPQSQGPAPLAGPAAPLQVHLQPPAIGAQSAPQPASPAAGAPAAPSPAPLAGPAAPPQGQLQPPSIGGAQAGPQPTAPAAVAPSPAPPQGQIQPPPIGGAQPGPPPTVPAAVTPVALNAAQQPQLQAQTAPVPVSPLAPSISAPQIAALTPSAASDAVLGAATIAAIAPATGGAAIGVAPIASASPFSPVEPIAPVAPRLAGEALVARQVAAVEQAERDGGPVAALRELNVRLREAPSGQAAAILAELQPTLMRATESFTGRVERVEGVLETSPRELARSAMARAGADLAAALDAGAPAGGGHVTEAVARAIATSERSTPERIVAFGEAVAFGAGLTLPFAMIGALEERGEHETARTLETALAGGLTRLLARLTRAVDQLSRVAGPVAFEWSAWRAAGQSGADLERRLRTRLAAKEGLTAEIDDALEAVEALGADMIRTLERLAGWNARTPEIAAAQRAATASRATAFAIAQSLAAQHVVAQALAAGLEVDPPGRPDEFSFDAARELYGRFGFGAEGAAELAGISLARHVAVQMAGGWLRARKPRDPSDEAVFARIVAFLKGDCAPSNRHIETVTFADLDPEGERPVTLVGAPLLDRYELLEAA